jgi:hypothetical protein
MLDLLDEQRISRLRSEVAIDTLRAQEFPTAVSRLSGLFVFDEAESALAAAESDWGGHIDHELLTDVGVSYERGSRVDASWVTQMLDESAELRPNWQEMARAYWRGEPCSRGNSIWELIADGAVTVWGTALRDKAYELVRTRFPESLGLLEEARIAAALGFSLGHVSAWLSSEDDDMKLAFYFDNQDDGTERYEVAVATYVGANPSLVNWPVLRRPDLFRLPELSSYTRIIRGPSTA